MGGNCLAPTHVCAVPCARPGLRSCAVADEPADGGVTIEGPRGPPWGPLARSSCLALSHPRLGIYAAPSSMAQMYRGGLAHRRGFSRGSRTPAGRGREGICKCNERFQRMARNTGPSAHSVLGPGCSLPAGVQGVGGSERSRCTWGAP